MSKVRFTGVLALCAVLAACDRSTSTSTPELTAPKGGPTLRHESASILDQYMIRADQDAGAFSAEQMNADLSTLGDASIMATSSAECVGLLIGTFDKVEVPPGATCSLANSVVRQWVKADAGSRLFIFNSQIGGNVMGLGATAVQVLGNSHVGGSFDVRNAGDLVFASCASVSSTIDGNVSCTNGDPAAPRFFGNLNVGGNFDVVGNFVPAGFILQVQQTTIGQNGHINNNSGGAFKVVNGNTVANVLACLANDAPFVGGPNVAKRTQGQCF